MVQPGRQPFRYEQIAQTLAARIEEGRFPTGRLPAERTLMQEFGVQRDTVRRALEALVRDGVLLRDSTRGTVVAPRPVKLELGGGGVGATAPPTGGVLLVVRTFEDTTAPAAVFRGLSRRLAEEGAAGIPAFWHDPGDKPAAAAAGEIPAPETLAARGVRGAAVWPRMPAPLAALRALRDALPLVLLDRRLPGFEADFAGFHDFDGGRTVTEHLLGLGHRRIGFLSGEPQASAVQARLAGYAAALRDAGHPDLTGRVLHQEGGSRRLTPEVIGAFLRGDVGGAGKGRGTLTAVVCANDTVAARLIGFARGFGMRVPDDLAVTGFGDLMPSMLDAFGITTVAQDFDGLGRAAADLLLRRIAAGPSAPVEEVELPMRLIVRESCGVRLGVRAR